MPAAPLTNGKTNLACAQIDPRHDPAWDEEVLAHPDVGCFHSAAWARVLAATYGHEPFYLRCSDENGLAALVPLLEINSLFTGRRGICLPFSDSCAPLLFGRSEGLLQTIVALARGRRWKYFELRGANKLSNSRPTTSYCGHVLDLRPGEETIWRGLASSTRRAIRKAQQSGVVIEIRADRAALLDFFQLHVATRRRHGLPPQPFLFFQNIGEQMIARQNGFIVLARRLTTPIASAVFLQFGRQALYKFGASDRRHQRWRGSNLVLWEGIRELLRAGSTRLHLGRTTPSNVGLRRFKRSWGTTEERIDYFRYHLATDSWQGAERGATMRRPAIFGRLPESVNRLAGSLIYPHLD